MSKKKKGLIERFKLLFAKKKRRTKRKKNNKKGSPGHQHPMNRGYKFIHKDIKIKNEKLHNKSKRK